MVAWPCFIMPTGDLRLSQSQQLAVQGLTGSRRAVPILLAGEVLGRHIHLAGTKGSPLTDLLRDLQAAVGDAYRLEEEQVAEAILDGDALCEWRTESMYGCRNARTGGGERQSMAVRADPSPVRIGPLTIFPVQYEVAVDEYGSMFAAVITQILIAYLFFH